MNDDQPSSPNRGFIQRMSALFTKKNSKEDLREYLQEAQDNNIIDAEEANMLEGVLAFSERRVRDVMLPKSKMVTLSEEMTFDEVVKIVIDSGHSRFPVESDEKIIGILLAKDLLNHLQTPTESFSIKSMMRDSAHLIPDARPLNEMLRDFRRKRSHMGIVTNEYGEVSGLITIEDAIEEIVGEIGDEHDREDSEDIRAIGNGMFWVNALTEVEDFNSYFSSELDVEAHDTIGGFTLSHFGYMPKIGEKIEFANLKFTVKLADERRLMELLVGH